MKNIFTFSTRLSGMLAVFLLLSFSSTAMAKIVMFENKHCSSCKKFKRDFGKGYLSSVNVYSSGMKRYKRKLRRPISFTPTFVRFKKGREVGRITGYYKKSVFRSRYKKLKRK